MAISLKICFPGAKRIVFFYLWFSLVFFLLLFFSISFVSGRVEGWTVRAPDFAEVYKDY